LKDAKPVSTSLQGAESGSSGESDDAEFYTTVGIEEGTRVLKLYKDLMESIRKGPSSSRKSYAIDIDWMRKFQKFGKALLKSEHELTKASVSIYHLNSAKIFTNKLKLLLISE
jgi:hypothetical protein